jgi:alkylated DNA repair dioxygenase AlkB
VTSSPAIVQRGATQLALLGREAPTFDESFAGAQRIVLADGAWLEVVRGWVRGHAQLFDQLLHGTRWRADDRLMYERRVEVPRLHGTPPASVGAVVQAMRRALDVRHEAAFERVSVALYRDGRDGVAWHGDYIARRLPEALVATVSLGAPRRFLVRPTGGGPSLGLSLGWGDLVVMGGSCQRTHQHCVPKVAHADPRIALMFRPVWIDPDAPAEREPR